MAVSTDTEGSHSSSRCGFWKSFKKIYETFPKALSANESHAGEKAHFEEQSPPSVFTSLNRNPKYWYPFALFVAVSSSGETDTRGKCLMIRLDVSKEYLPHVVEVHVTHVPNEVGNGNSSRQSLIVPTKIVGAGSEWTRSPRHHHTRARTRQDACMRRTTLPLGCPIKWKSPIVWPLSPPRGVSGHLEETQHDARYQPSIPTLTNFSRMYTYGTCQGAQPSWYT
ncbi:unnamed protein product [Nesidiocoris tenuis]|uniref:Uncharacterized protein n=1 Tax=Nesidiocoris tenuis TaxID=355587 RepID=A0A6H5GQP4_9HEMI|nr:unnamed protein product [Nesidiocoris tenuis]